MVNSLAEQLAQLANSAPELPDPEDDLENETLAKVTSGATADSDEEVASSSSLRKRSAKLLADEDSKYAGKTVSRRSLMSSDDDSDDDEHDDNDDGEDDDESGGELGDVDYEFVNKTGDAMEPRLDYSGKDDDDSNEDVDGEDDDDEDEEEKGYYDQFDMDLSAFAKGTRLADTSGDEGDSEEGETSGGDNEEEGVTTLDQSSANDEVKRGQAVQNQIKLWEALLELRIELQKLLNASNQLPQHDIWHQLQENKAQDSQKLTLDDLQEVEDSCLELSSELLDLQSVLQNSEQSDRGVKRTLDEMEGNISEQFERSQSERNDIIQKWDDKTRLSIAASSKGRGSDHAQQSTLNQIEHILTDKDRLLMRTRQKRNNIHVVGKEEDTKEVSEKEADTDNSADSSSQTAAQKNHTIDSEIFNDDDFYHQLLRELIEQKTNKSDDPIAMSRQWLEFQALRKKIKRTVDTRASKGRKLRYNVMPKLVNYMAPILSAHEWDDDRKDELFASLFDKKPEYKVISEDQEPADVVILR